MPASAPSSPATSGLGRETARALASVGADVTLAVRNTALGASVADDISASTGNRAVHVAHLDLADLATVTRFTDSWDGPLHLLINNAGVMRPTLGRTPQGWELQFATNHLGHFALALGLHDALAAGANQRDAARIVTVTSGAHMYSPVVFDDPHFTRRAYDPNWLTGSRKRPTRCSPWKRLAGGQPTESSPTRSTPAVFPLACNGISPQR